MKPIFFPLASRLTLGEAALIAGSVLPDLADPERLLSGVAPLETAGPDDLAYMDNPRYVDALGATRAGACLVGPRFVDRVPRTTATLVTPDPYRAYAKVLTRLHPAALRPGTGFGTGGVSGEAIVHPTALVAPDAVIDPAAVIGPHAEIGAGTVIGAHAVVGPLVRIGRDCSLGPGTSVMNAVVGDRVIIHPGARLGQDGFGYAMGAQGHMKVPQIGCVLVEDDVEIGANTTIDRGGARDTLIGEGTKIDNLVQIAHNVVIGRRCVIVAQVGIAGSTVLEDFVVVGGQSAIAGHLRIGRGAQIAAASGVMHDVPAGGRWGGAPAKPVATWFRELTTLKGLAARRG